MIHHERNLEIDATQDEVWAVICRYMHIDEFAPFVTSVDALTEGEVGLGSLRRCHFDNGSSLDEEVVEWQPNRGFRVRLTDLDPMPLNEAFAGISVEPLGDNRSNVTWSMDYQVKYGPFGWLLGQTVMRVMMGRVLMANLKGLAEKAVSNRSAAA
ncbi:MAG: SRPBCC family protein [Rhizobiaceae bacterium]|nr:SRPBCC family protein [Rhizobiaceae bacterium]